MARFDGDCKGSPVFRGVVPDHQGHLKFVKALACHCQANQSASVPRHEIDGFRRDLLRRDCKVALVFAIFVINDDDDAALSYFLYGICDAVKSQR